MKHQKVLYLILFSDFLKIFNLFQVENLINDLGLKNCANTLIGNTLIRGISGGERKRTSIGVELLNNPSLMFLDEPTTGLDSATALHVLLILKNLAKSGRTIISTIHQPSSEIFSVFDKLMLLVQGEIIYQVFFKFKIKTTPIKINLLGKC